MSAKIHDITQGHEPVALARDMLAKAPECKAGFAMLENPDGSLWFEGVGHRKKDLLWALERLKHDIITEDLK